MVELELDQIRQLLAPALGDAHIVSVARSDDGLVNTVYRVVPSGARPPLALRIYASGIDAFEKERRILERVSACLPGV
jgi:hypothetical protein